MINILANDGLGKAGFQKLLKVGFRVSRGKVSGDKLAEEINNNKYEALLVRSATLVDKKLIDDCPGLKLIGRVGAGMDNIDVEYATNKGIKIFSTPRESAPAVAELVFAHLFSISRKLYISNRYLPRGEDFIELKQRYQDGFELAGKTLGILGFGRMGQEVAKIALGIGMKVLPGDPFVTDANVKLKVADNNVYVNLKTYSNDYVIKNSDIVTLHVPLPSDRKPIITKKEMDTMKDGVILINASKSCVVDENDLIEALKTGKISAAGIDVYNNEPNPNEELIKLKNVSVTPHLGGATHEAQERISIALADHIINFFKQ